MKLPLLLVWLSLSMLLPTGLFAQAAEVAKKNILLLAGKPSHAPGEHEHNAGVLLLKKCLDKSGLPITTTAHLNAEWPSAEELAKADTILFYGDGGSGHFLLQGDRLAQVAKEMKRGAGFVCLHYAVEFPADNGGPQALDWMGGFFEANWSVNPTWQADYQVLPKHPIANGVKPFSLTDEWYFHMRFAGADKGKLVDILTDIPPDSTMTRKDGPHEGNPTVRAAVAAKKPQTTAWAFERTDGGRGFGFTGGHYHRGWAHDNQRKLVLNAILWTAKAEVPTNGVESSLSPEDMAANLDRKSRPQIRAVPPQPETPRP
jgi:type 1 glutamine amidotransferase